MLFLPFILIPLTILITRLVKYGYRIQQARQYGLGDDLLNDPLSHIGLSSGAFGVVSTTTKQVRRLQKEQRRLLLERRKREKENLQALSSPASAGHNVQAVLAAADTYLEELKQKTKKAWYQRISPAAVRRWIDTSPWARWWMVIQVLITVVAIGNYISLTYLTNSSSSNENSMIRTLDIFCATLFLLDYSLFFYTAEDRLQYYAGLMQLADLMSIVSPFAYLIISNPSKYVWFLGFIRIFRATRILRIYRVLSFSQSETTRELTIFTLNFFIFMFLATSIVNAVESQNFEIHYANLSNWHDALYYIIGTFSTTGSDLTPSSTISRILVMILTVCALIYIPWQTSKVIEVYNSLTPFQRDSYRPKANVSHIILAGSISFKSVRQFCRQFFQQDDSSSVVILAPTKPDLNLRKLLNHPAFRTRIFYLQGDVLLLEDLERAKANSATAFILLSSVFQPPSADTTVCFTSMTVKRYFPAIPIFAQLMDSKFRLISSTCGIDRALCTQSLRSTLLARSSVYPGVQTLIINLIHSCNEVSFDRYNQHWMKEYKCGLMNQIQAMEVPVSLTGMTFNKVVLELYTTFNVIVFFVSESSPTPVLRANRDLRLRPKDVLYIIGDGTDELLLRISFHYQFFERPLEVEGEIELEFVNGPAILPKEKLFLDEEVILSPISSSPLSSIDTLQGHIIILGKVPDPQLKSFVEEVCSSLPAVAILLISEDVQPVMNMTGVNFFFIKANYMDEETLEKARVSFSKEIVLFSENDDAKSLYLVKLVQQKWPATRIRVELSDGNSIAYFEPAPQDNDVLRMKSILSNPLINVSDRKALYLNIRTKNYQSSSQSLFYQLFRFLTSKPTSSSSETSDIQKTSAMAEDDNTPLVEEQALPHERKPPSDLAQQLLQQAIDQNEGLSPYPPYHFDSQYAAGRVVVSDAYLNALICRAYFQPFVIDVVESLVKQIVLLPLSPAAIGKTYLEVVKSCFAYDAVPFGIYRQEGVYVYTNPRHGDLIKKGDKLYVMKF